jgi:hypothetical protein
MSNGKCYNCDYVGEFDWQWLINDSKDDSVGYVTNEMTKEESEIGDTHIEIYFCPKCFADQ